MENYIQWKTTFEEKETQMKGDLWWKMTFDGRQSLKKDNFSWKITFNERQPLKDDNHRWKMTQILKILDIGQYSVLKSDVPYWFTYILTP